MSEKLRHKKDGEDQNKEAQRDRDAQKHGHAALDAQTGHKNETALDGLDRADFDRDLRPHEGDGINDGPGAAQNSDNQKSAYDFKEVHEMNLDSAELKQLSILPEGTQLEQGAHYLDLTNLGAGEIVAHNETVQQGQRIVAKTAVEYDLWAKLCGNEDRVN